MLAACMDILFAEKLSFIQLLLEQNVQFGNAEHFGPDRAFLALLLLHNQFLELLQAFGSLLIEDLHG